MDALILQAPASTLALARVPVLGLSIVARAALCAAEAGAQAIEVETCVWDVLGPALRRGRLGVPARARTEEAGERLLIRPEALLPAALLSELACGEGIADAQGCMLAARVQWRPSMTAEAALDAAKVRPFAPDRSHYALRVVDRGSLARARRLLIASLIKASDGPVSRHFNRHLSRFITRWVVPLGMTPNQMTVLVALSGVAAAYYAAQPEWRQQLLGALLFQLHSVIDGCDGEIARVTHRFSSYGALLDSLVDDASNTLFFVGLSYGVSRMLGQSWPLYTGAFTALCYAGVAYVQYAVVLRKTGKGEKTGFWRDGSERKWSLMAVLQAMFRRDVFVLLILIATALSLTPVVAAVLPVVAAGALIASLGRARNAARTV